MKIAVSENYYKGELLHSPYDLMRMAYEKRSVWCKNHGVIPAAVIINWQFSIVLRYLQDNYIYFLIK
jgi:hypothetical protein